MPAVTDYLLKTSGAVVQANVFVRLLSNTSGISYISDAVTDANGKWTMNNTPPPVGLYTVFTGPTGTIAGTPTATGDTQYVVTDPFDKTFASNPPSGAIRQWGNGCFDAQAPQNPSGPAKFDGQRIADGAITNGLAVLTSASNKFAPTDVGKRVAVGGAGISGTALGTTIASFQSAGQVTLAATASTSVTGAEVFWGSDDQASLNASLTAAAAVNGVALWLGQIACVSAIVDTPNQATGEVTIQGGGRDSTQIVGTSAVNRVVGLRMPGEVRDMTVDGGGICQNALSMATGLASTTDHMNARRVRCRNSDINSAAWVLIVWDTTQTYKILNCILDDVLCEGPSSHPNDAMAVCFVDYCYVRNLVLRNLYRSPNLYAINRLVVEGIDAGAVNNTSPLVIDAQVTEAYLDGIISRDTSLPVWINAIDFTVWGGEMLAGCTFNFGNLSPTARFHGIKLGGPINFPYPPASLSVDDCEAVHTVSPGFLADLTTGGTTLNNMRITRNRASVAPQNFIYSANGTTWDNGVVSDNVAAWGNVSGLRNITRGSKLRVHDNTGSGSGGQQLNPNKPLAPTELTGQTAAVASIATATSPNDGNKHLYRVSGTVTITTLGSASINLQCTYTDDNGTARTLTIPIFTDAGAMATAANTAGEWAGSAVVAVNPNVAITLKTAGTFTGGIYNVAAIIEQLADGQTA